MTKIYFKVILTLLSLFFIGNYALAQGPLLDPKDVRPSPNNPDFVAGELLVKFKPRVGKQEVQRSLTTVAGAVVASNSAIDVLKIKVPQGQEFTILEELRNRSDVEFVEPNYIAHTMDFPDDSFYAYQWALSQVGFPTAWQVTPGSSDVIIAVVDTGIDLDHPDFSCTVSSGQAKLTPGKSFVSGNIDGNDDNGHGSHVAGIAGACTNNLTGVAGAAPNVRLMPVKVLDAGGSGSYADVADGVIYAADKGADIINLSLGGQGNSSMLDYAIQYAYDRGVLVVAAAGNFGSQGNPVIYPAAYPNAMAVAATDSFDNHAYFSEYHPYVEVAAPGVTVYSTLDQGNYGYKSGTSMSTPYVSGLAALIWSIDPGLSHEGVRQLIHASADDLGDPGQDDYFGHGRINAWNALADYVSLKLQYTTGVEITGPIIVTVDDSPESAPVITEIQASMISQDPITWNVTVSPDQTWLNVYPSSSGLVSSLAYGNFTLEITRPATYGVYNTELIITGTTDLGIQLGPQTAGVQVSYAPRLYKLYYPLIFSQ